jgi:type I restriction enzyme S subunit
MKPKLRFKDFVKEWEIKRGSELFINSRTKGNDKLPLYSVTLDRGMVPRDSLDRRVESETEGGDNLFVAKNDISYNMMRMWQGAFGLAPVNCMVSPAYVVLHPKENVFSDFFAKYFNRRRNLYLFTAFSYGLTSDRLRLYFKDFGRIKFIVPSLPEQQKIASFLSAIDEKIQQLTRKKELLEQYKKGVMQQLFSGKLRFKDKNGKPYPKWEDRILGDLCEVARSGGTPTSTKKEYYNGDIPFLSISDMTSQGKYLNSTSNYISNLGLENSASWIVPVNSIIYSMYASVGFVSINKIPIATSQAVLNLILKPGVDLEFMYYVLTDFKNRVHKFITTGTQGNLNAQTVKAFELKIPCIEEQQKIASFLSSLDTKIESVTAQIAQSQTFKKGLLQQMFV